MLAGVEPPERITWRNPEQGFFIQNFTRRSGATRQGVKAKV
jgi:hypothetical protein